MIFSALKIASLGPSILEFIAKNWKLAIFLCLCGIIFYQNIMQIEWLKFIGLRTIPGVQQEIVELKRDLDHKEQQLTECENSRTDLKGQINDTNAQVQKWYDVSQGLLRDQAKLRDELKDLRTQSDQQVQDILAGPTPETCDAAIQYLKDAAVREVE